MQQFNKHFLTLSPKTEFWLCLLCENADDLYAVGLKTYTVSFEWFEMMELHVLFDFYKGN